MTRRRPRHAPWAWPARRPLLVSALFLSAAPRPHAEDAQDLRRALRAPPRSTLCRSSTRRAAASGRSARVSGSLVSNGAIRPRQNRGPACAHSPICNRRRPYVREPSAPLTPGLFTRTWVGLSTGADATAEELQAGEKRISSRLEVVSTGEAASAPTSGRVGDWRPCALSGIHRLRRRTGAPLREIARGRDRGGNRARLSYRSRPSGSDAGRVVICSHCRRPNTAARPRQAFAHTPPAIRLATTTPSATCRTGALERLSSRSASVGHPLRAEGWREIRPARSCPA